MEYTKLGNSALHISRICMGCMGFGEAGNGQHSWTIDEEHSRKIIQNGLELGINFFDTAIAYQSGTSEQYLGRAIKDFAKREDVVIATKFLPRTNDEMEAGITGQQHIEKMLDKSLENLGMDYVDLYIYHMWDYNTPLYDIMEGLNNAVKSGKARYIGISNCFAYQLAQANALAEKERFAKFVSVQGHYNLIFREEEREMVKLCYENHIAMTPYSPLAGGRLSKRPGETSKRLLEDSYAHLKYDATARQDGIIIDRVTQLADKYGVSMTEISLAWLLTKVTAPVVGTTKLHHIEDMAKATQLTLTADDLAFLEEPYVPHNLVGVMAQNTPLAAKDKHVWSIGCQGVEAYQEILPSALDNGITPIAAKEIVYQATDYLGYGRMLPFLNSTNEILIRRGVKLPLDGQATTTLDDRLEKGIEAQVEIFGEPMKKAWKTSHINRWLAANCFGDYYTRNGLNLAERELITFCFLMAQGGCEPQLIAHAKGNINMGNNKDFLIKIISQCLPYIGYPRILNAISCINKAAEQ